MNRIKMKDYLEYLKQEKIVEDLLKSYGLNHTLAKELIICYEFNVPPKEIAQRQGIHIYTIQRYYDQFGRMLETNFSLILNFYWNKKENRR